MREKIIKKVMEEVEKIEWNITCCLCDEKARFKNDWGKTTSEVNETEIVLREGCCDRDGGGYTEESIIDICPKCFKEKLIPWIEKQGGIIEKEEHTF